MKALFLLLFTAFGLAGQQNLVLNHSLEEWAKARPVHWEILENTVDVFRSAYRLIPEGMDPENERYWSKFPEAGSDGLAYFGIAHDEVIQCRLAQELEEDAYYKLTFRVLKPKLFNASAATDVFTVRFESPRGVQRVIKATAPFVIDTTQTDWTAVRTVFKGFRAKPHMDFGYFDPFYRDLPFGPLGFYVLFDDVCLYKSTLSTDRLTLEFARGEHSLSIDHKTQIETFLAKKLIHSIHVEGHASVTGSEDANYQLAAKRLEAVVEILRTKGTNITTTNRGESESVSGREASDRKVVIEVRHHRFAEEQPPTLVPPFDARLGAELSRMIEQDKAVRTQLEHQPKDDLYDDLIRELNRVDSAHQIRLADILDSCGYPGLSVAGPRTMDAAFLLLHHSPIEMRLKYEALVLAAVDKGEATAGLLPFFTDRNRIDSGQKQIYGTQLYLDEATQTFKVFDLEYPDRVDQLRREKRLMPLEDYLNLFNNVNNR